MLSSLDIDKMSQPEIYALICECLCALQDNPKYTITSELAFILDKESFMKFIKYFGGMTITIPKLDEFKETLQLLLLYQAVEVDKMAWRDALEYANFPLEKSRSIQRKLAILKQSINTFKAGKRYYD
jgi:hypothetical protein